jgi:hypothetical protein
MLAACTAFTGGRGVQICEQYDASPIPPGYDENGCWSSPDYFARPPEVIPEVGKAAPLLRIEASGNAPIGIEGTLFFVRAVAPSGTVILEREWDWPSMEQAVPPGAYQLTAYARICDGNCGMLDPPAFSCTIDVLAQPSMTYTMNYTVHERSRPSCDVAP